MKTTEKAFDGLMVLEYQSGNEKSFPLLVKRHHLRLCRHAYRYTKDIEASKDIVQESWKLIIDKMYSLKEPNSFASWATKIVTRKSLDYVKSIQRNREKVERYYLETKVEDAEDTRESDIKRLLLTIKELPENQQLVLKLFYIEEYSLKEISSILGISVGTTKSRLFHAREKLKTILKIDSDEKRD
ncbi:RNA polymerase sigma factor [Flagellimonas sp. 2504JD1-5]